MRLSYSALNRFAEQHVTGLGNQGSLVPPSGKAMLSDARHLSDDQLLQKLRELGMEMDRPRMEALVKARCSAEEIAKPFLDSWRPRPGQHELASDWCWFALTILWERWFPEVPSFERLDDVMQQGYQVKDTPGRCDVWLRAWDDLLKLQARACCGSLEEFDDRFGGTQSVYNWIQDLEIDLCNAGMSAPRYQAARVRVCEAFLQTFAPDDLLLTQNLRRAMAESIHALGDEARSESMFRGWLAEDPAWGWGWIGWSDLYHFRRGRTEGDLTRAEAILQEGLAQPKVHDRAEILERLAGVYKEQGRPEEASRLAGPIASARASAARWGRNWRSDGPAKPGSGALPPSAWTALSAAGPVGQEEPFPPAAAPKAKVGRNDPCPCGSQKKYKRCCGA